jgi:hypothetical protein
VKTVLAPGETMKPLLTLAGEPLAAKISVSLDVFVNVMLAVAVFGSTLHHCAVFAVVIVPFVVVI